MISDISSSALETAAAHAGGNVPVADVEDTVGAVLASMRGKQFREAGIVVVCAGRRPVGVLTIESLLAAEDSTCVATLMDSDFPVVAGDQDQEQALWKALHHDQSALVVVDEAGEFQGVIPPQRLITVLLEEHDEDVARLSGYLKSAAGARSASTERVGRRLWHRLPWLLVGLAGAMASAGLVDAFQAQLERQVLVAFFIPGIVYLADAVGTQTEAVVIRGLSVGVGIERIVRREIVTGVVIGALIAAVSYPLTLLVWHESAVSAAVSLSLFAACSVAAAVAMLLPWLFSKLKVDPAFGSGPLATVVQDLLSILVYLTVSTAVVG
ncbi:magnesium transporter [Nocardia higoensis]|uniref:magnesium transporter n=1 Tax=Nocardia higoensis TaxID=228599 RepID=UPI00031BD7E3|nr:magnesium transporter [Nocardia higoensis]